MRSAEEEVNRFIERIRPYLTELYRRAEVIAANEDRAEYIVQNVITEAFPLFLEARGRAAFQEGLYALLKQVALDELNASRGAEGYEQDAEETIERSLYSLHSVAQEDAVQSALLARVMREKHPMRRLLMLRYGCDLSTAQIGAVMRMRASDVRHRLRILNARLFRGAQGAQIPALEQHLIKLSRAALNRQDADVPEMTTIFQIFSENLEKPKKKSGRIKKIVRVALMSLCALLCAAIFWLISILLVPETGAPTVQGGQVETGAVDDNRYFI